jgi:hypothetical protein
MVVEVSVSSGLLEEQVWVEALLLELLAEECMDSVGEMFVVPSVEQEEEAVSEVGGEAEEIEQLQ